MIRQFIKGARAFCCNTSENNVQGLIVGREYDIVEGNHVIDGEDYIVVSEHHTNKKPIRVKAEHFA